MSIIQSLLKELEQEANTTRKMLERVPTDKFSWQPHPKSGTLQWLVAHIAELPGWVEMTLTTDELDFAKNPYEKREMKDINEVLQFFEKSLAAGRASLEKAKEEDLLGMWTLRNGDEVYSTSSKGEVIRMSYCQTVHHRAQLGVYLRLLDVPIPGSYGPSADEMNF